MVVNRVGIVNELMYQSPNSQVSADNDSSNDKDVRDHIQHDVTVLADPVIIPLAFCMMAN